MKGVVIQAVLTALVVMICIAAFVFDWLNLIPFLSIVTLVTWIDTRVGTLQSSIVIYRQAKDANVSEVLEKIEEIK
jgi:hypothetical protein